MLAKQFGKPTRKGHNFINWYKDKELSQIFDFNTETILTDINVYPKFEKQEYTVTLNLNDGNIVGENTIKVLYEEKATKPTNPTKDGYQFIGWSLEENINEIFDFNTQITEDVILYAIFKILGHNVNYEVDSETTAVETQTVPHGHMTTKPNDPYKEGHTLLAWYKEKSLLTEFDFANIPITEDITLYPKFRIKEYIVRFDDESAKQYTGVKIKEGQVREYKVLYNEEYNLAPELDYSGLTYPGFIFFEYDLEYQDPIINDKYVNTENGISIYQPYEHGEQKSIRIKGDLVLILNYYEVG